ncbi:MAG: FtsW/RodA/SpoVE family cell cycle protein, partial [Actinomycetota bacterium]|nr:FtsW/RodA/SpoVE family cell cycle protein [Actinomycetota bacterium]
MGMEGIFGEAVDRIGGEPISARMARKAPIRHLDPALLLSTLCLAAYGGLMIFSASSSKLEDAGADPATYVKRQIFYAAAGVVLLLVVSFFDYRHLKALAPILYGATFVGLLIVLTPLGSVVNGASRWIDLGFFQVQPSEIAKVATIVAVAAYLSERKGMVELVDIGVS